jgi:uncharacterized protein YcbK (DUF882 family)
MSEHFSIEEMHCHDGTAYPVAWRDTRLVELFTLLEAIRGIWDRPMRIISGYRTLAHNGSIGGARHSEHMEGRAADIVVQGVEPLVVVKGILELHQQGAIYLGGLGTYATFTHVDVRPGTKLTRWMGGRPSPLPIVPPGTLVA